ncbi:MAG: cation:proton antiporter, partial [Muribaculaceae bacterium]|nr:cation:proton antiporter [Muribaculaceae bacterium]
PMAYMLTIILIEAVRLNATLSPLSLCGQLLLQFGVGSAAGWLMGRLTLWLIKVYCRIGGRQAPDPGQTSAMIAILMLGAMFFTFAISTDLGGNGYLAVYITGIILGNARIPARRAIVRFVDSLTWLAQIVVFLMLGLLVNPKEMITVAPVSLLIAIFMIFAGRPLSVFLSLWPFRKITLRDKAFISWVGLRGAVPIIFASYPVVAGIEGASQIFNIVFFVTLLSLLIQGTSVIRAARTLDLTDNSQPDEDDFGVELADELPTSLQTLTLTERHLSQGDTLSRMQLPAGSLVMMVKRQSRYMVPNGSRRLLPGDVLLIIRESDSDNA